MPKIALYDAAGAFVYETMIPAVVEVIGFRGRAFVRNDVIGRLKGEPDLVGYLEASLHVIEDARQEGSG